jgi:hypothetical protein
VQTHLGLVGVADGDVSVLLNGGGNGRTFIRANMGPYNPGEHPSSLVSGKLDNDAYHDVAVLDYVNGTVAVLLNKGADGIIWNGFEQGVLYPVFSGSSPLHANLATADIDGDDDIDLLIGGEWGIGADSLSILRNNGDGSFDAEEKIPLDSRHKSETFTVLDYENDGDPDFVTANITQNLTLCLNDGLGNFETKLLCHNSDLGGEPLTILSSDLNGDNLPDIATLTITDDVVVVLNQDPITTGVAEKSSETARPNQFELAQNYPNPFNPATTIVYTISQRRKVVLKIYDILGREVITFDEGTREPGRHEILLQMDELASGVYLYRLQAGDFVQTRKMTLLR